MNDKITKVIIGGKEYNITDKQAQQIISILSTDVAQLKEDVEKLSDPANYWKVIR